MCTVNEPRGRHAVEVEISRALQSVRCLLHTHQVNGQKVNLPRLFVRMTWFDPQLRVESHTPTFTIFSYEMRNTYSKYEVPCIQTI